MTHKSAEAGARERKRKRSGSAKERNSTGAEVQKPGEHKSWSARELEHKNRALALWQKTERALLCAPPGPKIGAPLHSALQQNFRSRFPGPLLQSEYAP